MDAIFKSGLMEYTLKYIDTDAIINDYYLRIFMVNDIDTNFISVFIPEIYDNPNSNFIDRDEDGKLISKPCEVEISAYKSAPSVGFRPEYMKMQANV